MKRIIMFVLLFAALKVAGQTTGYLRFDTVKIMKQNGTCELYVINKTKDSLGLLTNVGGGLTRFIKSKMLNDSMLIVGLDTLTIHGAGGATQRFGLEDNSASANRTFNANGNNFNIDSVGNWNVFSKSKTSGTDRGALTNFGFNTNNSINLWSYIPGSSTRSYGFNAYGALTQMFAAGHVAGHATYVQSDTLQVILEADPNRLYMFHDSVVLHDITGGSIDFRIRTLPETIDTSYKALVSGPKGQIFLRSGDAGSGGGGGDSSIFSTNYRRDTAIANVRNQITGKLNKLDTVTYETVAGDSLVFIGTSITQGFGPTITARRYSTLAAIILRNYGYGFKEYNLGVSGSKLSTRIADIPIKRSGLRILVIEFGTNELLTAVDSATYRANQIAFIDTAIARGWSPSQMAIVSQMGSQLGIAGTEAQQRAYNFIDSTDAIAYGCTYIDAYNPQLLPANSYLYQGPDVHPNDEASISLANIVAGGISKMIQYNNEGQELIVDGKAQFGDLIFKNKRYIATGSLLGTDSTGKVGTITELPAGTRTQGTFILGKGMMIMGNDGSDILYVPSSYDSTRDVFLGTNSKIIQSSGVPTGILGRIVPFSSAGQSEWVNTYSSGQIKLDATNLRLQCDRTTFAGNVFDMVTGELHGTQAGVENILTLSEGGTADIAYKNKYQTGVHKWYMSNGTNNNEVRMMTMFPSGSLLLQKGGTHTEGWGLDVQRSMGANKDSITLISSIGSNSILVQDTTNGKFQRISASTFATVLKGTTNWTPGVVAAGSSTTTTITVTGAVVGDPVTVSKLAGYSNGEIYDAFVSATNTVTLRVHNVSTGSANYSSAADYNVVVLKY